MNKIEMHKLTVSTTSLVGAINKIENLSAESFTTGSNNLKNIYINNELATSGMYLNPSETSTLYIFITRDEENNIINCIFCKGMETNRTSTSISGVAFVYEKNYLSYSMKGSGTEYCLYSNFSVQTTFTPITNLEDNITLIPAWYKENQAPCKNVYEHPYLCSTPLMKIKDGATGEQLLSLGQGFFLKGEINND